MDIETELTQDQFDRLPEYSLSLPTLELHEGKMIGCTLWKRRTETGWLIGRASQVAGVDGLISWTQWVGDRPRPIFDGAELIASERKRQIEEEHYDKDHDDSIHTDGELAMAACCYASPVPLLHQKVIGGGPLYPLIISYHRVWPWREADWNPKDRIRNLVRAGALIAAEIDRLQRLEKSE